MSESKIEYSYLSNQETIVINKLICEAEKIIKDEFDSYLNNWVTTNTPIEDNYNKQCIIVENFLCDFFLNKLGFKKCIYVRSSKKSDYTKSSTDETYQKNDKTQTILGNEYEPSTDDIFTLNTHTFKDDSRIKQHIFSMCGIDPHITFELLRSDVIEQIQMDLELKNKWKN